MDRVEFFPSAPVDYFLDNPDRRWPAWKFEMELDDLFNTLPQQFNYIKIPVLDRDAFSRDVLEVSYKAQDKSELIRLLTDRMESRRKELLHIWLTAFREISGSPSLLASHHTSQWSDAMHIYRFKSFDAYVRYFARFLNSNLELETPSHTLPLCDHGHDPSTLSASSRSPAVSARGDAAFSDRAGLSCSVPTSAPSPKQMPTKRKQPKTRGTRGQVPPHRRTQPRMRSSDGIWKATPGESRGLRRSSRLKQRLALSAESGTHTRSKTAHTGMR